MRNDTSWKFSLSRTGAKAYKLVRCTAGRAMKKRGRTGIRTGGSFVHALLNPLLTLAAALAVPAVILVLALWLDDVASGLATVQIRLLAWFPLLIMAIGIAVAARFNRARILAALLNLTLGYAALIWLAPGLTPFEQQTLLAFLFLLLPLNHLFCHVLPDHAAVSSLRLVVLAIIGLEAFLFTLTAGTNWTAITSALLADVVSFTGPQEIGLSDLGFVAATVLLTLSFARLYTATNTQRAALFVSSYCLLLVLANFDQPATLIAFAAAGALILTIAAFQETWNIAYLDQLTELPGRRALEEALARLDGPFAIAMMDVDHFKKFNDTYGHDVGDQVLRMVAAQMKEIGSGAKAYRYGGEEFTMLLPGRTAAEAMPIVDALREAIGEGTFEIRRRDRREGGADDASGPLATGIQVTVSGGIAERRERHQPPVDVMKAADEALYKAKRKGRNRVEKA